MKSKSFLTNTRQQLEVDTIASDKQLDNLQMQDIGRLKRYTIEAKYFRV